MSSLLDRAPLAARGVTGVALTESALHVPGAGAWPLTAGVPLSDAWREALRDALREARARVAPGQELPALAVALFPALAPLRLLALPKMRPADLDAVLARNAARYFPAARDRQTIAAARVSAGNTPQARYVAAAASAALLRDVERAAADAGWRVDRFVPAYAAWAAAGDRRRANARRANARRTESVVVVPRDDGGADLLHVTRGLPTELRRLRADDPERRDTPIGAVRIESPMEAAARTAARIHTLELRTDEIVARRQRHRRTLQMVAAAAAVVLLVGGAGLYWWQVRQTLHEVTAQRAQLKPAVDRAAQLEAALNTVALPAQSLARVEEHGVRWSAVLNDLATSLPPDAYIEAVRAMADTITIDGAAKTGVSAGGARVFEAVAASDVLSDVVPVGSIRRDAPTGAAGMMGAEPVERFTLKARVDGAARLVPPPTKNGARP